MWKNENNDVAPQRMTEALADYENAVREFSSSASEFLRQIPLLTKAREAYQRATVASTQLREILDRGDETLRKFMAQMQETVNFPQGTSAFEERGRDAGGVEAHKIGGEKADAARV
jgi:exonuclease VII small subunit